MFGLKITNDGFGHFDNSCCVASCLINQMYLVFEVVLMLRWCKRLGLNVELTTLTNTGKHMIAIT